MPIVVSVIDPGVACVTISQPARRNALDLDMFESLAALWPRLDGDDTVNVVVLHGDGDTFCAGADLGAHLDRRADIDDLVERALLKTGFFGKPIVAAIRGACVAGGLEIVLAVDVRIAAEDAVLGLPEVRWGLLPSGGGAMKLADQIGYAKAMDLLLTGRLIQGREAEAIGLVTLACPPEEVWDIALARARLIAANSPIAVQAAKKAAALGRTERYLSLEAGERALVARVRESGHPELGKAAFLAGRQPNFHNPD